MLLAPDGREGERSATADPLSHGEREFLSRNATCEGVVYHKRSPGDFGLYRPAAPRPDKTLCDAAGDGRHAQARDLLARAIDCRLVSDTEGCRAFPSTSGR